MPDTKAKPPKGSAAGKAKAKPPQGSVAAKPKAKPPAARSERKKPPHSDGAPVAVAEVAAAAPAPPVPALPVPAPEPEAPPIDPADLLKLVTFLLDGEEYGFPIMRVQEILRARAVHVTPVPNSPDYIDGVMNLRGRVIPVIGLRKRFGLPLATCDRATRVIVVEVGGRTIGACVDAVREVVDVDSRLIEPLPDLAATGRSDFIVGVSRAGGRIVIVVDMERVFSPDEKAALADLVTGNREGSS